MTTPFHQIKKLAIEYKNWLLDKQWFNLLPSEDKLDMLESLNLLILQCNNKNLPLIWECSIDHLQATNWTYDTAPYLWIKLNETIEDCCDKCGITSTNQ